MLQHFIHFFNRRLARHVERVEPATLELLLGYHWPGNVRELENLVERAMIIGTEEILRIDPRWLLPVEAQAEPGNNSSSLGDLERRTIVAALERCRGKIYGPAGAATALGLKPTTLYGKMRKHGIARNPSHEK